MNDAPLLPAELLFPGRIRTGPDALRDVIRDCSSFGPCGVLVHGLSAERSGLLDCMVVPQGVTVHRWRHPGGEPTLDRLETLRSWARGYRPDWVLAVGGGSVIDLAKACAGLLEAGQPAAAYHDGADIPPSRVPFAAVPSTAGTGSEVTTVSVLTNTDTGVKKSIRHVSFMARHVALDARVLNGCPAPVIASAGMDALAQAVESCVSRCASWFSDVLALRAAHLVAANLEAVFGGARGDKAEQLLTGSLLSGLALSSARLGVVHGLAHPLGARYRAPHGLVCAWCLAPAIAFNREAMGDKYGRLSEAVGGDLFCLANALPHRLQLPSPFRNAPLRDRARIVAETLASGSTRANPRPVEAADVEAMLDSLFDSPRSGGRLL